MDFRYFMTSFNKILIEIYGDDVIGLTMDVGIGKRKDGLPFYGTGWDIYRNVGFAFFTVGINDRHE
jgi:hypothetical protein